jgi:hypothetical protein
LGQFLFSLSLNFPGPRGYRSRLALDLSLTSLEFSGVLSDYDGIAFQFRCVPFEFALRFFKLPGPLCFNGRFIAGFRSLRSRSYRRCRHNQGRAD